MAKGDSDFERQAQEAPRGLVHEMVSYFWHSGKWWLAPVFLALFVIAALIGLGQTAVAPFIYTLF
jgi:hypothetical protein